MKDNFGSLVIGLCFTIGGGYALYKGAWPVIQSAIASKESQKPQSLKIHFDMKKLTS